MLDIKCPYCNEKLESIPDSMKGQQLQCAKCCKWLTVPKPKKQPLPAKKPTPGKLAQRKKMVSNIFTKAWHSTPAAFRTGFLTTLGVIAAIGISVYLYTNYYISSSHSQSNQTIRPAPQVTTSPQSPTYSLAYYEQYLANKAVFPIETKAGILRGRQLTRHTFSPDVNYSQPCLSIWTDSQDTVCGISALWNSWSETTTKKDMETYGFMGISPNAFTHSIVRSSFENLIPSPSPFRIDSLNFLPDPDEESPSPKLTHLFTVDYQNPWSIQINYFIAVVSDKPIKTINRYLATAQTW